MAEEAPSYDELRIRFHPAGDNCYRSVATAADDSIASATFEIPFTELELDNFVLRVGRQRLPMRNFRSTPMEEARRLGERLFEALMVEEVRDIFRSARGAAESSRKGLRLTLCLSEAPELMDLPWEFLYEKPRFLSQSIYSPVVRSLDLRDVPTAYPLSLPLNVLGLISSPNGFTALDVEREKAKLTAALGPLYGEGLVTLEWLDGGTLKKLDEAINQHHEIHIFHFVGHGGYDTHDQSGTLILENEYGDPHEVSGEELGLLLQDERSLRLAVLNSCEGARSSHIDPFSGAAASLVHYGVPAVIGMQFEITDEAAIAFAGRLYDALARGFPVDAALAQARRSIFAAGNDIEFGTPVLFLRGRDARLFDVVNDAPAPVPLPAEPDDSYVEELKPLSSFDASATPTYQPWLPRPWQEWWFAFKADMLHTLARIPSRVLARVPIRSQVIGYGLLFLVGTIITTAFGQETAGGDRQSTLGAVITIIGLFGLVAVAVRAVYAKFRTHFERLRNWWTGNG
jgi:CHAT domain-containing protein